MQGFWQMKKKTFRLIISHLYFFNVELKKRHFILFQEKILEIFETFLYKEYLNR